MRFEVEEVPEKRASPGWNQDDSPVTRVVSCREVLPQAMSETLVRLSRELPMAEMGLSHLKRVKRDGGALRVLLGDRELTEEVVEVPKEPAETLAQFEKGCALWPMVRPKPSEDYAVPDRIPRLLQQHHSQLGERHGDNCAMGCGLLVAPGSDRIVSSKDESNGGLLDHPAMVCIRANARHHCVQRQANNRKRCHEDDEYLCTGFDIILTNEPCVMCAMALVHARIRFVVFEHPNSKNGGLGGCDETPAIHTLKSINHRYRAFRFSKTTSTISASE